MDAFSKPGANAGVVLNKLPANLNVMYDGSACSRSSPSYITFRLAGNLLSTTPALAPGFENADEKLVDIDISAYVQHRLRNSLVPEEYWTRITEAVKMHP
jgi:hypothetical protein